MAKRTDITPETLGKLSWLKLNQHVTKAQEDECELMLRLELRGKKRVQFLLRIHARLNKLRAHRERISLKHRQWNYTPSR